MDIYGAINGPLFPITLNRSYNVSHDLLAVVAPCIQCIFKLELPAAGYFGVTRDSSAAWLWNRFSKERKKKRKKESVVLECEIRVFYYRYI